MSNTVRKQYQSAKGAYLDDPMELVLDDEVFVARPHRVPATVLIDFQGLQVSRDPDAMWAFFRCAMATRKEVDGQMVEDLTEFDRFHEWVQSPLHPIEADTLGEMIKDMVEFTTGRPTEQLSS